MAVVMSFSVLYFAHDSNHFSLRIPAITNVTEGVVVQEEKKPTVHAHKREVLLYKSHAH